MSNCKVNKPYATNMSVTNCDFDGIVQGSIFKYKKEPNSKCGYQNLNPETLTNMYDLDYYPVGTLRGSVPASDNMLTRCVDRSPTRIFSSSDPRLISAAHDGMKLTLDRPPIFGEVRLKDIYVEPTLENYGKRYKNYSDIKAGQIMYYFDKSIEDTYFHPIFENDAVALGRNYVDPMNSYKPSYERIPIRKNQPLYPGGLSSIADIDEHREDIISLQMRPQNRTKYSARWT